MARSAIDPITFEVIRNALVAATDEMVLALRRSAYSTNIKTRSDFSCAFFDAELRAVAQGFTQPVHLGSMVEQMPRAIRDYGPENLGPGDVIITNDPFPSGVHLNDVSLISPVHHDGELLGYVANLAHHVDVGGGAPASIGAFREVFQEGVIIPPVKVVEAGRIVDDVFRADPRADPLEARDGGRLPRADRGEHDRRPAAAGARRPARPRDDRRRRWRELLDYTERRTRAEIAALPHGVYEAEGSVDTDGYTDEPVRAAGAGRDLRRRASASTSPAPTRSGARRSTRPTRRRSRRARTRVKCLIDPDLPVNDGFYRLVSVDAPAGTVTNCTWPRPVVGGWETQTRLVDVIFRALLPALPERLPGGDEGDDVPRGLRRRRRGDERVLLLPRDVRRRLRRPRRERRPRRGADARPEHRERAGRGDRAELPGARRRGSRSSRTPTAPGRFRGGLGLRKDFLFDRPTTFTVLADRTLRGPCGRVRRARRQGRPSTC